MAYLPELSGYGPTKSIYLNGDPVPVVQESNKSFVNQPVELTGLKPGQNSIVLKIDVNLKGGFIRPKMELWACCEPLQWKFRGGVEGLDETAIIGRVTNWAEFLGQSWTATGAAPTNQPVFWHTTFDYRPAQRETVGLVTTGLNAGHVWLNGHNLGESPQKVLLYMPECWLKPGANDLVILDVAGAKADQVKLQRYESRQVVHLK